LKLFISPHPSEYTEDGVGSGGIWRVINAQGRWLPEYGIELVNSEAGADVVMVHAGSLVQTKKPLICVNHGLYWTGDMDWHRDYWQYNIQVIEALREAHRIIVPSEWVAQPIRRDMKKRVDVIPHGIDFDEFKPQAPGGYVLWAKPRVDVVSDPRPVNELAMRALNTQFVTTYGRPAQNVKVIGAQPHDQFKKTLARASVWLATARETGDIASREAMALGIPVLGWDWGATGELVIHGKTGYLAKPGDYDDLLRGLHFCLDNRAELGNNGRMHVQARYQWRDLMAQYAQVIYEAWQADQYPVEVSVIIPTYNYAHYLPECLDSLKAQTDAPSMEVIVVDDASTDNTQDVLKAYEGLRVIRHYRNGGLCAALNTGHDAAHGRYWINLDADNVMALSGIRKLYDAIEARPWVDVATGMYSIYGKKETNGGAVDYKAQLDHANQIPSTCIARTRSTRAIGGYRQRQRKNEDAEFWCRAMSAGLRCEYLVDEPVFVYRWHGENKTAKEGGEDDPEGPLSWNFYYPWRAFPDLTPFGFLGKAPNDSWPVRSYEQPHIAVIIPVGPGHDLYLMDALDSVYAQTFREFECIVANDTGEPLDVAAMGHPWVKVVDTGGRKGAAYARNLATEAAKAPLIVPLDADDLMYPGTLRLFYQTWLANQDCLVYADCFTEDVPGKTVYYHSGRWTWEHINKEAIYQDTCLFAKEWWAAVGGYDDDVEWEDWIFGLKMHMLGIGAAYLESFPWGVYRHWTSLAGGSSKSDGDNAGYGTPEVKERIYSVYAYIARKEKDMPCKGCGKKAPAKVIKPLEFQGDMLPDGEQMMAICIAPQQGTRSMNSKAVPGKKYTFSQGTILTLERGDEWVVRHKDFERYIPPAPEEKVPELPKKPPVVQKLAFPVEGQVPVRAARAEPEPEPAPAPVTTQDVPVASLGLSETIVNKLLAAGFETKGAIRQDVIANKGKKIRDIKGIGPAAFGQIQEAVFG